MTQPANPAAGPLVLVGAPNGHALISYGTPLTRLNYFDGKFLRAEDLNREQYYLRSLVALSNQAGGTGVVHGFTTTLGAGGMLDLSPGLAVDPAGRVLLLSHSASVGVLDLIQKSQQAAVGTSPSGSAPAMGEGAFAPCEVVSAAPPTVSTTFPTDLYLIAIGHAEALCGEEDVYGKLCEDACATSTDRPLRMEGIVLRAIPLTLCPPTCNATWLGAKHRRSQVASAYYATERALLGKNISAARLKLDLWCHGAEAQAGSVVPLAVVSVNGTAVEFLDAWAARRERMEAPPRRFWAWQTMMRPYNVFLAQILQFQCHLHEVLGTPGTTPGGGGDPCAAKDATLQQAVSLLEEMEKSYEAAMVESGSDVFRPDFLTRIADLKSQVGNAIVATDVPAGTKILIDGGIVELPPAGYLPVVPGIDVNAQVRALLGDGVDLRFCSVRPDYVAHALEEAQHMERICLLQGIDNPAAAQEVDILVPDGSLADKPVQQGRFFETDLAVIVPSPDVLRGGVSDANSTRGEVDGTPNGATGAAGTSTTNIPATTALQGPKFRGATRSEVLASGGGAFHFAGLLVQSVEQLVDRVAAPYQRAYAARARTVDRDAAEVAGERSAPAELDWSVLGVDRIAERLSTLGARKRTTTTADTASTDRAASANETSTRDAFTRGTATRDTTTRDTSTREASASEGSASEASASEASLRETATLSTRAAASRAVGSALAPALWTTMRCDKNPFSLAVGDSTPIRIEVAGGAAVREILAGAQLILFGDLFCDQSTTSATGRKVTGRAWGQLFAHTRIEHGGEVETQNRPPMFVPVRAELELKPAASGAGGTLVITVTTQQGYEFSVSTEWKNTPILSTTSVTIDLIDTLEAVMLANTANDPEKRKAAQDFIARLEAERPELHAVQVASARLQENAAVREESNPHHAAAVRAIRTISAALDDEGFQQTASNLLFPAALPATREKRLVATRDWVLFHRRRSNSCDCCTPEKKVVAPPRRYQLYEITAPGDSSVEDIREFLASGRSVEEFADVVGVVEFTGGTATLTSATNPSQIREGWKLAVPADAIIYGAVASEGAAINDGEELGEQRAARAADLVRSLTPIDPGAPFDVLPIVPVGLSAQGLDGVILLVTMTARVQTQRHRVAILPDQGMIDFIKRQIDAGKFSEVVNQVTQQGLMVENVEFQADTATVVNDSLKPLVDAWRAKWGTISVRRAMVVLPSQGAIATASAEMQCNAIANALNGQRSEATMTTAEALFNGAQAITLLEPGQRDNF